MQPLDSLIPMMHVADVPRSIAFYERLGFRVTNTFEPSGQTQPVWAALESGGAQLMIALADEPVVPSHQAVLFYVYCEDVTGMHADLRSNGVATGAIDYPFYCPRGEFRVTDPDGYTVMVTHT